MHVPMHLRNVGGPAFADVSCRPELPGPDLFPSHHYGGRARCVKGKLFWVRLRKRQEEQLEAVNKLPAALLRRAFSGQL